MTSRGGRICFGSSATSCEQRTLRFEGLLRPGLASCVRKALGQTLSRKLRAPPPNFVPLHMPRAVAEIGNAWSAADYASAAKYLQAWSRRVGDVFTRYDVLLTPTLAEPPPLIGALKPSSAELAIMNVIGPLKAGWF